MAGTKRGPMRRRSHLKAVQDAKTAKHPPQAEGTRLDPGAPQQPDWNYLEPTCRKKAGEPKCLIDHGRIRRAAAARWRLYIEDLEVAGQLARVDGDVLKDACLLPSRIDEYERRIALEGATVGGRDGSGRVRHPLFIQVNQYRVAMNKARAELGLSPGAREGITPRGALPSGEAAGDGVWDV